jgi:hypothetical protein
MERDEMKARHATEVTLLQERIGKLLTGRRFVGLIRFSLQHEQPRTQAHIMMMLLLLMSIPHRSAVLLHRTKDDSPPKETCAPAEMEHTDRSAADAQATEIKELRQRVALLEGIITTPRRWQPHHALD